MSSKGQEGTEGPPGIIPSNSVFCPKCNKLFIKPSIDKNTGHCVCEDTEYIIVKYRASDIEERGVVDILDYLENYNVISVTRQP